MKRKLLIALLAVVGCFVCIFGLAACADGGSNNGDGGSTGGNETHKHTYSEDWTYDEMYHWHEATCEHKNEISGKSEHTFKNNVCSVCGYKLIPSGLEYELNEEETAYTVTGIGTCKDTDIVIPAEYGEGIPVTGIGETAFSRCNTLTSIIIPDNVTSIGEYAFSFCSALTSIEIPGGVTSIEKNVFYGCSSLTSIEIPDSVTSIGDYAFA